MKKLRTLKCIFFILCFSFLFSFTSSSQGIFEAGKIKFEAGLTAGPSFFLGDLGGNAGKGTRFIKDINLQFTDVMVGAFITAYPVKWFGLRLAVQRGSLSATDEVIESKGGFEVGRKQRNLDFRSKISEAYAGAEIFPLMFINAIANGNLQIQPYGIMGLGIFHFNPQGSLTDAAGNKTWYNLHPLRTEGQGMSEYPERKKYSLTQYNILIGGGIKYELFDKFNVSFESLYRKSFTDYIDDVSTTYIDPDLFSKYLSASDAAIARQIHDKYYLTGVPGSSGNPPGSPRGHPNHGDSYFSLLLKFGVRLDFSKERKAKKQGYHLRCPSRF